MLTCYFSGVYFDEEISQTRCLKETLKIPWPEFVAQLSVSDLRSFRVEFWKWM